MKNTATITQPVVESSHQQMIAKAEQEISRLEAQQRTITLKLQADRAELQALAIQATAHAQERDIAQKSIDQRRKALREAEAQCELASGTLASKPTDVKSLEKLLKQSQQEQMILLDRIAKSEQMEDRRRIALSEAIDRHQRDLTQLAERKSAMVATKNRVFAEQGNALYQAQLSEFASLQDALNKAKQGVRDAEQAIEDMGNKALQSLSDWPEHVEQIIRALPYSDTTVNVLDAAIGLLDILLSSGHDVEQFNITLLREAGIHYQMLENILSFDVSAVADALYAARISEPTTLREKKASLSRLREVYTAQKKEVRG